MKLNDESLGGKALTHWNTHEVLGSDPKNIGNKSTNRQMGLYQTKNIYTEKGNNPERKKTTFRLGENTFKL